jgi:hypothetical protein
MFKTIAKKKSKLLSGKALYKSTQQLWRKEFMKILIAAESCDNLRPGESSF